MKFAVTIREAGRPGTTTRLAINLYADATFASTNQPWVNGSNTCTAIAGDSYGRWSTNSVNVATNSKA